MTFLIPSTGVSLFKVYGGGSATNAFTTSFSFPSQPIGTPDPERRVIVAVGCSAVTAVNVGGIAATPVVSSSAFRPQIWIANVPTGTAATIAVFCSVNQNGCGVHCWSVYPVPPVLVQTTLINGGTVLSDSTGFIVGAGIDAFTGGTTISWIGLVEDASVTWTLGPAVVRFSAASRDYATGTIACGASTTSGTGTTCAASYRM